MMKAIRVAWRESAAVCALMNDIRIAEGSATIAERHTDSKKKTRSRSLEANVRIL
jgi:hypothetical protein